MREWIFAVAALLALAIGLLGHPALAQLPETGRNHIASQLVAESAAVPGGTLTLAIVMKPEPGWHGYWKNPGDAGIETRIDWELPAGIRAGGLQYPVPDRLLISGLMNYVYKGDYAQLVELDIPAGLSPGARLPVRARMDYLACTDEICVPESAEVATEIRVASEAGARNPAFETYRQKLPKPLGSEAAFERRDGRFRVAIPLPASLEVDRAYFFPLTDGAIDYSAPQSISRSGDFLIVEAPAATDPASFSRLEGVLKAGEIGLALTAAPGAVPAAGEPIESADQPASDAGIVLAALAGALLGGLLLNIMPCVFPILSLKALSLAKTGGEEKAARREALAYTAGVVLVCLALGGLLLALRAGGAVVGWAFQLQDPRVIMFLLLLVTAIALNLAGLFQLPGFAGGEKLARRAGAGGAFWTGALAAFIATPCTGPFMGAALGAALVLTPAAAMAVFAGLGLGLALPFLLLGFIPPLRRMLPKPGAWMGRFRRLMSVPMFLTALALAWILGRQSGVDGMALGVSAAVLVALALWWLGRKQSKGGAWIPLAPAAAAAVAAILLVPTATAPAAAQGQNVLNAETFSEERLAALQAEGRPVFVYFTADWCVTCKVNEKAALEQQEVAAAFADKNVAVLVGDWTRGDADIGRFLDTHGRTGVPLYLYYAPGRPVEILPQVLTTGRLISMLG